MHIVLVHVHVKPETVEEFKQATLDNASHSVQEPGIARFDVIQNKEDPTRFVLIEVYRQPEAAKSHKETEHYARWRERVTDMMAEPRIGIQYSSLYPENAGW